MNWDDLKLFLAVARRGSVSGAARQLGVQHSTVSRRLRALEEKLGTRLLERKKSGYELTVPGERLRHTAENVEREVLAVDDAVHDREQHLGGELRVSAINNMASTVLMPMFAGFSERYPAIELHIVVSNDNVSLVEREADIAIRLTNTPTETLIGKRLGTVASTVYGSRRYITRQRRQHREPDWLGVECCGYHRSWTRQACPAARHRFYSDDTLLTLAALKQDLGLAYLPCFMGDSDPALQRYQPPDAKLELGLWLLIHPDLRHNARVLAFREYLSDAIQAQLRLFAGLRSADDDEGQGE